MAKEVVFSPRIAINRSNSVLPSEVSPEAPPDNFRADFDLLYAHTKLDQDFRNLDFTKSARMPLSLLGGGMASGGLEAAAPNEILPADNAPQLAAGWFTLFDRLLVHYY